MTFRRGDRIIIKWQGTAPVPGWIVLASDNQISLIIGWDVMQTERMIAGHIGGVLPLLRDDDGVYHELFSGDRIDIEPEPTRQ